MEKTKNLQLNIWAPTERLFLDEWNENFETIDRVVENTKTQLAETTTNLNKLINYANVVEKSNIYEIDASNVTNFVVETENNEDKTIILVSPVINPNALLSVTVTLRYINSASIIFPDNVIWQNDEEPTFEAGKIFMVMFQSFDNGITWLGVVVGNWPIQKPIETIVSDDFTRPDSTTSVGIADTGQTWLVPLGVTGISSNKLYPVSGEFVFAGFDLLSDFSASFNYTIGGVEDSSFTFRTPGASTQNRIYVGITENGIGLFKEITGVKTKLGEYIFTWGAGETHNIKVVAKRNRFRVFLDGTERITSTEDNNLKTNKHMYFTLYQYNSAITRIDNFRVESV
ncbi:hypothetical protein ACIQYS_08995 [Psychrobacillus sp. NPDC096426]|uniref:hypothetical protein n=1 Tax=Psychrobacillus sp. NPDC096426 TaxID=3364491 RepID=UPI00380D414C